MSHIKLSVTPYPYTSMSLAMVDFTVWQNTYSTFYLHFKWGIYSLRRIA
jgi:hypothetical protein